MTLIEKIMDIFPKKQVSGPELLGSEKKKVKLGLIVGHDSKEKGAKLSGSNMYEYDYNLIVALAAQDFAAIRDDLGIEVELILRNGKGIEGAYKDADKRLCDIVIELHFNSSEDVRVDGCETLCSSMPNDIDLAHQIQADISVLFNNNNRGVKVLSRSDRGYVNVGSFPNGANCLVEPFFGSNIDYAKFNDDQKLSYAVQLVKSVYSYCQKKDLLGDHLS